MELRLTVAELTEWLANRKLPWSAYRYLMSGRLIALDKQTGVRTVRVGGAWRRLMEKFILRVKGQEAKAVFVTEHLTGEVKSSIEGGIHNVLLLWAHHS